MKIVANRAECAICHDLIESKTRHDFVQCKCGEIFVDGGTDYIRRGANNLDSIIDRSLYEEVIDDGAMDPRD